MTAIAIGGVEDHVHLLISLPSTLAIAKAVQLIKFSDDGSAVPAGTGHFDRESTQR